MVVLQSQHSSESQISMRFPPDSPDYWEGRKEAAETKNLGMETSKKSVRALAIASQLTHCREEAPATALADPARCMSTPGSNIVSTKISALLLGRRGCATSGLSAVSPCRQRAS